MNADAGPPAPGNEPPQRRRIGEFLVERGLVTPAELEKALVEQRLSGKRLGEILVERGSITRMGLAGALGEQWEEAGRHLRAVAPLRLADGQEAAAPVGVELTTSLASLQAAVSRLEDLAARPSPDPDADAAAERSPHAGVEEALAGVRDELAALVEPLAARVEELRGAVEERHEQPDGTAEILERLATLEQSLRDTAAARDREEADAHASLAEQLAERLQETFAPDLARVEERLDRDLDRHEAAAELQELRAAIERLGGLEELLTQTLAAQDERLAARLEDLRGAVEQKLERPDGTADVLERLERLDESLRDATARDHELRAVLEQPREDLAGRMGGIEHALGEAHRRLDDLRAALDQPRTDDAILDRLDALEALVRTKSEARLAELEQGIEEAQVAELAERDARIAELTGRVEQLSAQAAAAASARDAAGPQAGEPTSFLALVPRFESYELVALEGPLPAPGSRLDVDDEDMPFVVSRVGRSPLPADTRPCVYLEPR